MNSTKPKQYFTVSEANQRLPLVRVIVDDIVILHRDLSERAERIALIRKAAQPGSRDEQTVYSEELDEAEKDLELDRQRLEGFIGELVELGAELKDPSIGLIDFPTLIDGREAYLCWKRGENEIAFWHELDAGFEGRQSLLENSVSSDNSDDDRH